MVDNTLRLGRVGGIEIGVHYTWLFGLTLVAWSLASGFFPANYPGWDLATYWLVGILAALALFVSVLIHELSHSFVALARGQGVDSITLFLFGGVSNLKAEPEHAKDEFLVSLVGPLTSFVLAAVFWGMLQTAGPGKGPVTAGLAYLAVINALLGVFNLLPGFPLDGGRVLRSIIWGVTGNLQRATTIASYVGQGLGFLLIFLGVWRLLAGDVLGGLWTAFIGWFLNSAAEAARQQVRTESLGGTRVGAVMNPNPPLAASTTSAQDFVFDDVLGRGNRALLVADDGHLLGIISVADLRKLPQEAWAMTPARAIMTPIPLKIVSPDDDIGGALQLLVDGPFNQLPVVKDGRVVGVLSRADVLRFLQPHANGNGRHPSGRPVRSTTA